MHGSKRMRETAEDLAREKTILNVLGQHFNSGWRKLPLNKYSCDAILTQDRQILAWVECKWYEHTRRPGMNCAKYLEITHLAARSRLPAYLGMRRPGEIGFLSLALEPSWEVGGGNNGRKSLDDDVEPMVYWDFNQVRWILSR